MVCSDCHDYEYNTSFLISIEQETVWVASAYERHTGNDLSQVARLWGHECVYIQAINMIKH